MTTPARAALDASLTAQGVSLEHEAANGIRAALGERGAGPEHALPLHGQFVQVSREPVNFTAWLLTESTFTRYEWTPEAEMTYTCPLSRISGVTVRRLGNLTAATIELDAQHASVQLEAQSAAPDESGPVVSAALGRVARATYELAAQSPDEVAGLTLFVATLRSLLL